MVWLLKLYPRPWRARYGGELAAILAAQQPSFGLAIDLIAGALDARLQPQVRTTATKGDATMATQTTATWLLNRCSVGGPKASEREQRLGGFAMIATAIVFGGMYIWLRHRYHGIPAVEAVGYMTFPAMLLFYSQLAYLRGRSAATQIALVGGSLMLVYLFIWAACAIAFRL